MPGSPGCRTRVRSGASAWSWRFRSSSGGLIRPRFIRDDRRTLAANPPPWQGGRPVPTMTSRAPAITDQISLRLSSWWNAYGRRCPARIRSAADQAAPSFTGGSSRGFRPAASITKVWPASGSAARARRRSLRRRGHHEPPSGRKAGQEDCCAGTAMRFTSRPSASMATTAPMPQRAFQTSPSASTTAPSGQKSASAAWK